MWWIKTNRATCLLCDVIGTGDGRTDLAVIFFKKARQSFNKNNLCAVCFDGFNDFSGEREIGQDKARFLSINSACAAQIPDVDSVLRFVGRGGRLDNAKARGLCVVIFRLIFCGHDERAGIVASI